MTSKLSVKFYKGNYKWVQNQLRLFATYKVCGSWIPGRYPGALEGKLTGGISTRPFHPAYLLILSLAFRPFFFQTTEHAALWLRCPQWQPCGSFCLCLGCGSQAGSWFHDCWLSLGWWRSQRVTRPSYSQSQKSSSQSLQTPNTSHLSLNSSQSPKPNTNTTGKPEPSRHNVPAGKLNGLESFIPEWSLLSNISKHIAHGHRGLEGQPSAHMQEL